MCELEDKINALCTEWDSRRTEYGFKPRPIKEKVIFTTNCKPERQFKSKRKRSISL